MSGRALRVGYAALDVETTGFTAGEDGIVEIAVVTLDIHREPIQAWHSLVNAPRPIPADATRMHGITDRDVASAPTMAQLAGTLWPPLAGRVLVAHKAAFDSGFLDIELPRPDPRPGPSTACAPCT